MSNDDWDFDTNWRNDFDKRYPRSGLPPIQPDDFDYVRNDEGDLILTTEAIGDEQLQLEWKKVFADRTPELMVAEAWEFWDTLPQSVVDFVCERDELFE